MSRVQKIIFINSRGRKSLLSLKREMRLTAKVFQTSSGTVWTILKPVVQIIPYEMPETPIETEKQGKVNFPLPLFIGIGEWRTRENSCGWPNHYTRPNIFKILKMIVFGAMVRPKFHLS